MNLKVPGKKKKNVSVFSHEYIITNHGDIVSFVAMIIVIGLMFHSTAPYASLFIVMHHNVTANATAGATRGLTMYTPGRRDVFAAFFYTMISIVIHAVIQEYGLDKLNRKLHLSKIKYSKFNESGQLAVFYLVSALWGGNILYSERYVTSLSSLWQDYPHLLLPFWVKFYFIFQICYWLHGYPELYFQKVKKDEMPARIIYTTLYLITVTLAYALNLTRLGLCLLVLHYSVEFIFHVSRLLYFSNRAKVANFGSGNEKYMYMLWNVLFVLARVATLIVAYLTFNVGLEKTSRSFISFSEGNFNTKFIRVNCFGLICVIQGYMMWNFINFHLRRMRERSMFAKKMSPLVGSSSKKTAPKKTKRDDVDISELPEVDQNQVRQRKSTKSKA